MADILTKEEIDALLEKTEEEFDDLKLYNALCEMREAYRFGIDIIENFLSCKCNLWREGDTSSLPAEEIHKYIDHQLNDANNKVKEILNDFFKNETEDVNGYIRIKGESTLGLTTKEFKELVNKTLAEKENKNFKLEDFVNKNKTI